MDSLHRRTRCFLGRLPRRASFNAQPRHPRLVACAVATLLLGAISAAVLVWDVGASFASTIPVLSGVEPLMNVNEPRSASTTVRIFAFWVSRILLMCTLRQIGLALTPTSIDLSSSSLTLGWWATACGPTFGANAATSVAPPSTTEMVILGLLNTTCGRSYESFSVSLDSYVSALGPDSGQQVAENAYRNPVYVWNASESILNTDGQSPIQ